MLGKVFFHVYFVFIHYWYHFNFLYVGMQVLTINLFNLNFLIMNMNLHSFCPFLKSFKGEMYKLLLRIFLISASCCLYFPKNSTEWKIVAYLHTANLFTVKTAGFHCVRFLTVVSLQFEQSLTVCSGPLYSSLRTGINYIFCS